MAALVLFLGLATSTHATTLETIYNPGMSDDCGDFRCCWQFDFRPDQLTDELIITLRSDVAGALDNCIDWNCFVTNLGSGATFTKLGNGQFKITFNPPVSSGQSLFTLCPIQGNFSCAGLWGYFDWTTSYLGVQNDEGGGPLYDCNNSSCQGPCDGFRVYTNTKQVFCFTRWQAMNATSITMTFNPPISACNLVGMTWSHPNWVRTQAPAGPGPYTSITFTAPPEEFLGPCKQFCVEIPMCAPYSWTTVTMTGSPNPSTCSTKAATLKPVAEGWEVTQQDGAVQNFPNPVTRESGMRTRIPFSVAAEGEAILKVYNNSGKLELTTSQSVQKGENAFELSAQDLAPGTYLYVVESPAGVPIVRQTMVVIK